jgi:GxxExxY protein
MFCSLIVLEGATGEDEVRKYIIGAAIKVHRELGGPGLLENIYEEALCQELVLHAFNVQRQYAVEVEYKGRALKKRLVLDLLIEDKVVVEVKSIEKHNPLHDAQLLTCLRVFHRKLDLLVIFAERYVAQGVRRVVNGLP